MNDKTGFDIIEKGFQEDLEKERNKERAKLEEEIKAGKHPKFSKSQTDWMLAKYPYANNEHRDKAIAAEDEKRRRQQEAFDAEVEKRHGEKQAILEQLHFGKNGRQFALEQAEREEKIQAFKQRQREKREQEEKAHLRTNGQSKDKSEALAKEEKENRAIEQGADAPGQNSRTPYLKDDFNYAHSKQEIDEWQDAKPETHAVETSQENGDQDSHSNDDLSDASSSTTAKEEKFKEKMRDSFNAKSKEQSTDLEPEM